MGEDSLHGRGEDSLDGLTDEEAAARLRADGPNALPDPEHRSAVRIIAEVLREPMFALLLGAAILYGLIGELIDTAVLLVFACLSILIAAVQESRSERVLEALRDLASPRALVIRGNQKRRIPGREVVSGDLLIVGAGDRVPADAAIVSAEDLHADESILTGESMPVFKRAADTLFSGTLLVRGTGVAVVIATGVRTQIGQLGRSMAGMVVQKSRLQVQTRKVVLIAALAGAAVSLLAIALYGLIHRDWLQAILAGIALGMAVLPEEFPLVLTVFMVMGAWRLSRANVLTRRPAAIETLGAATVLCADKTGTLTENRMSVALVERRDEQLQSGKRWRRSDPVGHLSTSAALLRILETAALASVPESFDPMDRAVQDLSAKAGLQLRAARLRTYPLTPELLAVTAVWQTPAEGIVAASKGAPEEIARLCRLSSDARAAMLARVDELGTAGLRVLAVARSTVAPEHLTDSPAALSLEYLGLICFADPVRATVPRAIEECRAAGIRVVMITGDYPVTARAIALEAQINAVNVLSGEELNALDDDVLRQQVRHVDVFARIMPQQKLRLVEALKANGEIVAMTGDGVNDAPALKAAHIGIAMGSRGTDVAREAASLVLLDDDFSSLVQGIWQGRRIYDNLRKAMAFIVAIHVPIAGLATLTIALGGELLLPPMLIAFLELIIDPSCSVILEAEPGERNVMSRPPRDPRSPLLSRPVLVWSLVQGSLALLVVSVVFLVANRSGMSFPEVRSMTFVSLVLTILVLVFVNRSFSPSMGSLLRTRNAALAWGLAGVLCVLSLLLSIGGLREFLGLGPLHPDDLVIIAAIAGVLIIALQTLKRLWRGTLDT